MHVVDVAEDGAEALARFRATPYDLVLMDVQMPVLDGNAATRAIREWERAEGRSPTPILALTANAFSEDVQRSLDAGCTAHLSKPISKASLLAAIAGYTGNRGVLARPVPDVVAADARRTAHGARQ